MSDVGADPSPASIDRELARAESRKRRTRLILAASALFAVVGVVVLQLARVHRHKRVLRAAWSDAAGCLFGGPLEPGQSASRRLRSIKLNVAGIEGSTWPARCADPLATLHYTLVKQKKGDELKKHAHKLMTELQSGHGAANLSYSVDQLVAFAAELGLSASDIDLPAEQPPTPVEAANISTLSLDARLTEVALGAHAISADRWQGAELSLLLNDDKLDAPPILCTFDASGPEGRCRTIGGAAASADELRLGGTGEPGAPPLLFARAISEDVVYRSDTGKEVTRGNLQTAWIRKDGYVAIATGPIDDEIGTFELLQQKPGNALTRHPLGPQDFDATTLTNWAVVHGLFVLQSVTVDENAEEPASPRLRSQKLPTDDPKASFVDAGELDWVNAPMSFCAADGLVALAFGTSSGYLAVHREGRWSPPRRMERLGNVVQCRDDAVLLHDFGAIRACDARACKDAKLEDADFGALTHVRPRRTVLGDKLLGVAESDVRQGIRYVYGAGEPQLLFDDLERGGEVQVNSTVSGTRIFSRARFAVVTLFTEGGVFAFYVGTDGRPVPARITWR